MIDEERYCIDILTQLRAIRAALGKVETQVLKDHADHCVAEALKRDDEKDKKEKIMELVELFERYNQ